MSHRKGSTLIELMVWMAISAMIILAAGRFIPRWWADLWLSKGAAGVHAALYEARNAAVSGYRGKPGRVVGVRLLIDPEWTQARLADGTIDRTQPHAYARTVPLVEAEPYRSGLASIHADGWPAGFTPLPGRLVLEQSPFDADGRPCEPTTWFWLVRVGDVVTVRGREYTVCGPTLVPFGPDNPDGCVNWGLPGAVASPLDRGAGPMEWLYLTDRADDDGDGFTDEGWDGLDNDLDGATDEADEWEQEAWANIPAGGVEAEPYRIDRRPIEADVRSGGDVADKSKTPSPIVVDGRRSAFPVNSYTGSVDVAFDDSGAAWSPTIYGRPASPPLNATRLSFWVCGRADVTAEPDAGRPAKVVGLHLPTGRATTADADPTDVAGAAAGLEAAR
jgi:hypothetical protein